MSFRFFFSYSWENRGTPLERFYEDLARLVRGRVGGNLEEVSFRDRITMEAGTNWPEGLLNALCTSQVLVYLISADYIRSGYCGKELQAFLERVQHFRDKNPDAKLPLFMQPVIWVPPMGVLPKVIQCSQLEDDAFPADYAKKGLESLAKRSSKDMYEKVVEELANRVVAAAEGDRLPVLTRYREISSIPNAFEADEPARIEPHFQEAEGDTDTWVQCVYVAPREAEVQELTQKTIDTGGGSRPLRTNVAGYDKVSGWHWRPYQPTERVKIGSLIQQLVTEFPYDSVQLTATDPDDVIMEKVRQLAEAAENEHIVLVVVDAWSTFLKGYRTFLEEFDKKVSLNNVVLVLWNEADADATELRPELEGGLRVLLRRRFESAPASPFFKPRVTCTDEIRAALPGLLRTIRDNIDTYRAAQRRFIESSGSTPQVRSSRD